MRYLPGIAAFSVTGALVGANIGGDNTKAVEGLITHSGDVVARVVTRGSVVQCIAGFERLTPNTKNIYQTQSNPSLPIEITAGIKNIQVGTNARIMAHTNGTRTIGPTLVSPVLQIRNGGSVNLHVQELRSPKEFGNAQSNCELLAKK